MAVFLRGSSYYVKVRRNGRQVLRSLNTADKREALARSKVLLKALGTTADTAFDTKSCGAIPQQSAPTLAACYEQFKTQVTSHVANGHVRPSYQLDVQGLWNAHLSRFSSRTVGAELNRDVIDHLDSKPLSVARRRKTHTLLRKSASIAGVNFPPQRFQTAKPPKEKRPLTVEQLTRCKDICLAYPHPVAKLIFLAAVTGARIGEIMALTHDDIGVDYIS